MRNQQYYCDRCGKRLTVIGDTITIKMHDIGTSYFDLCWDCSTQLLVQFKQSAENVRLSHPDPDGTSTTTVESAQGGE